MLSERCRSVPIQWWRLIKTRRIFQMILFIVALQFLPLFSCLRVSDIRYLQRGKHWDLKMFNCMLSTSVNLTKDANPLFTWEDDETKNRTKNENFACSYHVYQCSCSVANLSSLDENTVTFFLSVFARDSEWLFWDFPFKSKSHVPTYKSEQTINKSHKLFRADSGMYRFVPGFMKHKNFTVYLPVKK